MVGFLVGLSRESLEGVVCGEASLLKTLSYGIREEWCWCRIEVAALPLALSIQPGREARCGDRAVDRC